MTASDHLKHRTGSLGGDQDESSKQKIPEWALREDGSLGNTMVPKLDMVQEHLARLASERYDKILELEREKIDLSADLAQKTRECEELSDNLRQMTYCRDDLNRLVAQREAQVEQLGRQVAEMSKTNAPAEGERA